MESDKDVELRTACGWKERLRGRPPESASAASAASAAAATAVAGSPNCSTSAAASCKEFKSA
eukprot:scaffold113980_cov24-Tisochrysis_lutea.AAC.6